MESNTPAGGSVPSNPSNKKRKGGRGAKKRRPRRQSFAAPPSDPRPEAVASTSGMSASQNFYLQGRNLSGASLESEALLDHRDQQSLPPRRPSVNPILPFNRPSFQLSHSQSGHRHGARGSDGEGDEGAPLLGSSYLQRSASGNTAQNYGSNDTRHHDRRESSRSSARSRANLLNPFEVNTNYNVNYPPSMPGSPPMGPRDRGDLSFGDSMLRDDMDLDIEDAARAGPAPMLQGSPFEARRNTVAMQAEEDVCFPQEGMSEIAEEELHPEREGGPYRQRPRRRRGKWPDLAILDEFSRFEKEGRSEERRAMAITEPQLINGRLRAAQKGWHRVEDDAPYRFTYFNEEFESTIHSQTISELVQPGTTFRQLFIPDPPLLSDSSDDDEDPQAGLHNPLGGYNGESKVPTRQPSLATTNTQPEYGRENGPTLAADGDSQQSTKNSSENPTPGKRSPAPVRSPKPQPAKPMKAPKYGERPIWWLDIFSPTEAEMKALSKAFGIHPLTAEDILVQEPREKVELFRNYYFVSYRSFDQDVKSENFLEPVNMYVVVFREGVLSFHFSMTPHPANVRRRIRQLSDYLVLSSDWVSYAIIDDITDVFVPMIQKIEDEVDDIDDAILQLHSSVDANGKVHTDSEKPSEGATQTLAESGGDMLRRVGDCRKKVMGLYRLLGNKADVIKGFAKRCNEHWEVAPRSEIGLYLGDIQDHIVTMTSNLGHYEKILARSHANYLAQINLRMNERQEQTADVLGKLTVLGTIVLPMNIITGLWGMNVWVPGQEYEGDLKWFFAITGGLLMFGLACYWVAKRVYRIV